MPFSNVPASLYMKQGSNGLGLKAVSGRDYCEVTLQFPDDTIPKWVGFPTYAILLYLYLPALVIHPHTFCQ